MANEAPDSPNTPPRDRTQYALVGAVGVFCLLTWCGIFLFVKVATKFPEFFQSGWMNVYFFAVGMFVAQPMMIGIWTALGPGSVFVRLLIAAPFLLLISAVPAHFIDNAATGTLIQFVAFLGAVSVIYFTSTLVFLLFRRFRRLRVVSLAQMSMPSPPRLSFSIKHLFMLMSIYAVALTAATTLKLSQPDESLSDVLGMILSISIMAVVYGLLLTGAALPAVVPGMSVLYGRVNRFAVVMFSIGWLLVSGTIVAMLLAADSLDEGWQFVLAVNIGQLGTLITCLLTAAALRAAGLRSIRLERSVKSPGIAATTSVKMVASEMHAAQTP